MSAHCDDCRWTARRWANWIWARAVYYVLWQGPVTDWLLMKDRTTRRHKLASWIVGTAGYVYVWQPQDCAWHRRLDEMRRSRP